MRLDSYQIRPDDRILYLRLSAIGDVINAIPGLVALRHTFPGSYIAWCVEDLSADLLRGHPMLDGLLVVKKGWLRHPLRPESIAGLRALVRRMRALRFTVAIDAHNLFKSGLLALLSGAPIRAGANQTRNYEGHKFFLNVLAGPPVAKDRDSQPAAVRRARFLPYLGVGISHLEYILPPFEEESARVEGLLGAAGITRDDLLIVLNACASWPSKQWPGDHYVALGRMLAEAHDIRLIWTGSRKERPYVERLARQVPSLNLAGQLNLRELAALLARVKLMVTGDTGPMHLGAAVGTFVVGLFGPTDPRIYGPFTERKLLLTAAVKCRHCTERECRRQHECLNDIQPREVAEGIMSRIG